MTKNTILKMIISLVLFLSVITAVSAISWSTIIPDQTHVENSTTAKSINLSQYASSDATGYSIAAESDVDCSITNDNLTFVPVAGFASSCKVACKTG